MDRNEIIYIKVDYNLKEFAYSNGARYNFKKKMFFIPKHLNKKNKNKLLCFFRQIFP